MNDNNDVVKNTNYADDELRYDTPNKKNFEIDIWG